MSDDNGAPIRPNVALEASATDKILDIIEGLGNNPGAAERVLQAVIGHTKERFAGPQRADQGQR